MTYDVWTAMQKHRITEILNVNVSEHLLNEEFCKGVKREKLEAAAEHAVGCCPLLDYIWIASLQRKGHLLLTCGWKGQVFSVVSCGSHPEPQELASDPSTRFMSDPNRSYHSWCHIWRPVCVCVCVGFTGCVVIHYMRRVWFHTVLNIWVTSHLF